MTKKFFLTQAFSLTMLLKPCHNVKVHVISEDDARILLRNAEVVTAIKDKPLAEYLSEKLDFPVIPKRRSLYFSENDLIVVQYRGPVGNLEQDNPIEYYQVEIK